MSIIRDPITINSNKIITPNIEIVKSNGIRVGDSLINGSGGLISNNKAIELFDDGIGNKTQFIPRCVQSLTTDEKAVEYLRSKQNPLYWIYNYAYLPLSGVGGSFKVTPDNLNKKMKMVVRAVMRYHNVILMSSRQLGKSSIAALLLAWAAVFFPETRILILNMKRTAALNNLATIKSIVKSLPTWMVTTDAFKSKSEIITYLTLFNDSKIEVFFPSTVHSSSTLARSLTSPILYVDESAFIRGMEEIFSSAQQTLSTARKQAAMNSSPYFILTTSTPNGANSNGIGGWFFNRWTNAISSDLVFDTEGQFRTDIDKKELDSIVSDPSKNTFIKIKYLWSEDKSKDHNWYLQQKQELGNDRLCNQELDLVFIAGQNCIFSDKMISSFTPVKQYDYIILPSGARLNVYSAQDLNPHDYYLIGVDTAESLQGAFCAIQIFSFENFTQIAEIQYRYGSYNLFGKDIDFVFRWLLRLVRHDNIILCIENNTIGRAPIEYLQQFANSGIDDEKNHIDYDQYMYREKVEDIMKDKFGVNTNSQTKSLMVGCLVQAINDNPQSINSQELIDQFSSIERTYSGSIKSSGYSDLFMSACFCALVKNKKAMEILPLISSHSSTIQGSSFVDNYTEVLGLVKSGSNKKQKHISDYSDEEAIFSSDLNSLYDDDNQLEEEDASFFPFFTQ